MSTIFSAVNLIVTEYMLWLQYILNHPLYSYILWHSLLFVIVLIIFYDSRQGFIKTINIFIRAFYWFKRNSEKRAIDHTVLKYRESSKRVYLNNVLTAVAITLIIASLLYFRLIFFSVVVSDSMNPTLKKGDLILMQNIVVKPKIGDIIIFQVPYIQMPVTHRIISISGDEIRMKGDANPSEDTWRITKSNILGKSIYVSGKPVILRNLGYYFLIDTGQSGRTYGPEFNAISELIKWVKGAGYIIFTLCIILYLAFSFRDARRIRY